MGKRKKKTSHQKVMKRNLITGLEKKIVVGHQPESFLFRAG